MHTMNKYVTCDYCSVCQKLTDVWVCQKCGAPLRPKERPTIINRVTSIVADGIDWAEGIDISRWQGNMNWRTAAPLIDYAIIKASENVWEDAKYIQNIDGCQEYEVIHGVYHYCRPEYSWQDQADFFSDRVVGQMPAWVDIESNGGLSPYNLQQWLYNMVSRVEDNTGYPVGIYTRGAWWNSYMGRNNWAGEHPLWIARYNSYLTGPWSDGRYRPYEWDVWHIWQWSADGNGMGSKYGAESFSIDLDRFNGTTEDFLDWLNLDGSLEDRVEALETEVSTIWVEIEDIKERLDALEGR